MSVIADRMEELATRKDLAIMACGEWPPKPEFAAMAVKQSCYVCERELSMRRDNLPRVVTDKIVLLCNVCVYCLTVIIEAMNHDEDNVIHNEIRMMGYLRAGIAERERN